MGLPDDPDGAARDIPEARGISEARDIPEGRRWTFLTNHARVLLVIARNPRVRLRDIADGAQITERAAQAIVNDLEASGYLSRTRVGRRNHYTIDPTRPFRHPAERDRRIGGLLSLFADHDESGRPREG